MAKATPASNITAILTALLLTPAPVPLPALPPFAFDPVPLVLVAFTCVAAVMLLVVGAPVYALMERSSK